MSVLSAVDVLRADLDGGECGCRICSFSGLGQLVDCITLEPWPDRLRSDKPCDTLSILGNGETGVEATW